MIKKKINLLPPEEIYRQQVNRSLWSRIYYKCYLVDIKNAVLTGFTKLKSQFKSRNLQKASNKKTKRTLHRNQMVKRVENPVGQLQEIIASVEKLFERVKVIDSAAIDMTNVFQEVLDKLRENSDLPEKTLQKMYQDVAQIEVSLINHLQLIDSRKSGLIDRQKRKHFSLISVVLTLFVLWFCTLAYYQWQMENLAAKILKIEKRMEQSK